MSLSRPAGPIFSLSRTWPRTSPETSLHLCAIAWKPLLAPHSVFPRLCLRVLCELPATPDPIPPLCLPPDSMPSGCRAYSHSLQNAGSIHSLFWKLGRWASPSAFNPSAPEHQLRMWVGRAKALDPPGTFCGPPLSPRGTQGWAQPVPLILPVSFSSKTPHTLGA